MCVICVKPVGSVAPSHELLDKMYASNPDLCGISFTDKRKVVTLRGIDNVKDIPHIKTSELAVYHFRIATSGKVDKLNSQPIPIDEQYFKKDYTVSKYSLAHNGVFYNPTGDKSDTRILSELVASTGKLEIVLSWLEYLCKSTTSKVALLAPDKVYLYGNFTASTLYDGLYFSNLYFNSYGLYKDDYVSSKFHWKQYVPKEPAVSLITGDACLECGMYLNQKERDRYKQYCEYCYPYVADKHCIQCDTLLSASEIETGLSLCFDCVRYETSR